MGIARKMGRGALATGFILFLFFTIVAFISSNDVAGWFFLIIIIILFIVILLTTKTNPKPKSAFENRYDNATIEKIRELNKNRQPTLPAQKAQKPPSPVNESDLQNNFVRFNWRQMEELTGKLFTKKGYSVEVTQASADFGIDVWATKNGEKIGIQVKHWNQDVGFDDVTKTLGSNLGKANKYILISTKSFFTNQAWEHQRQHSHLIELWDTNRFRKELRDNFINSSSTQNNDFQVVRVRFCDSCGTSNDQNATMCKNCNTDFKPKSKESGGFVDDTDSFDYDKGFNIDEVYDTEIVRICPQCRTQNTEKDDACSFCLIQLIDIKICKKCRNENDIESNFCKSCGALI